MHTTGKIYSFLLNKKTLVIAGICLGVIFLLSLWHRYIQSDENWFGEQAWYLAHEGVVRIKTMAGIPEYYSRIFIYHPLLIHMGAWMIKAMGWSVYLFKSLTLFFYLVFFFCLFLYVKLHSPLWNTHHFFLALFLIAVTPAVITHAFMFRPEIYVMTWGFLSYTMLSLYFRQKKIKWVFASAAAASMAFLTTFNASLFCVAGFLVLLYHKEYKAMGIFALTSLLLCSVSTIEWWSKENFHLFLSQIHSGLERKFPDSCQSHPISHFILVKMMNLLNEPQRFFWSDRVFVFSSLFFLSLLLYFKKLWQQHRLLMLYFFFLVPALNLLGIDVAERYLIYLMPYMALLSSAGLLLMLEEKRKPLLKAMYLLLMAGMIMVAAKMFVFIFSMNNDHVSRHREVVALIPGKNLTVVAPWPLIYNEIGKHHFISYKAIEYQEDKTGKKMNGKALFDFIYEKYHAQYVIVQQTIKNEPDWYPHWFEDKKLIMHHSRYTLFEISGDFLVFKAI